MHLAIDNTQNLNQDLIINFNSIKNIESKNLTVPLYIVKVQAGLPSPVEDYYEANIDLSTYLIKDSAVSFVVGSVGDYMFAEGISQGDLLIIDRVRKAIPGNLVVAVIQGALTLKKLEMKNGKLYFNSEHKKFPSVEINDVLDTYIWGVVTNVIHDL